MRWLSRLITAFAGEDRPIARRTDADFGAMWRNTHDVWRSQLLFRPTGEEVSLHFFDGTDAGPTAWQRQAFREMVERYPSFRKNMEEPLRRKYEEIRKSWKLASQALEEPGQIWAVAHLARIEVYDEGYWIDFSFDFCIDWENEDHDLNVCVKDWEVLEVKMEG